jgi:hypothetical protein
MSVSHDLRTSYLGIRHSGLIDGVPQRVSNADGRGENMSRWKLKLEQHARRARSRDDFSIFVTARRASDGRFYADLLVSRKPDGRRLFSFDGVTEVGPLRELTKRGLPRKSTARRLSPPMLPARSPEPDPSTRRTRLTSRWNAACASGLSQQVQENCDDTDTIVGPDGARKQSSRKSAKNRSSVRRSG